MAYEMARQLAAGDHEVALLALVDVAAPLDRSESPDEAIFAADGFWLADVAAFLARLAGQEPAITQDELSRVAGPKQVGFFVARMEESGDLAPGTSLVQLRRLLRVYKTNVRASWSYQPLPYSGRPLTPPSAAS